MSKFYDFEAEDVMCNMHKMEEYQKQPKIKKPE